MSILKKQTINLLIKCLAILFSTVSSAFAANYDTEVFEFQQKLAKGGDANAQYRLATMYESGRGVKKDNSMAMKWYKKSSSNNNTAAKRQLEFIDIKQSGFKDHNKAWLKSVYSDAKMGDENALIILAKIHENGTGVKKNLKKSQRYYKLAFNRGNADAEANFNRVGDIIAARDIKKRKSAELATINKDQKSKPTKKEIKNNKIAKNNPKKHKPQKKKPSTNTKELKRLEAERNKLARERKELEALKKEIAATRTSKVKPESKKPIETNTIVSNVTYNTESHGADACSTKAARFMSRCQ